MKNRDADMIKIVVDGVKSARQAAAYVRSEADWLIEQAARRDRGWDRGLYRDDDVFRTVTIRKKIRRSVQVAFAIARKFA